MVSVKASALWLFTDFFYPSCPLLLGGPLWEKLQFHGSGFISCLVYAAVSASSCIPSSFFHIWLYFPAHVLVPMLAFLWSKNEGDKELAIQKTVPCPLPRSIFGVDGIPGVRSLGGCSAAAAPTLQSRTPPVGPNLGISFHRSFFWGSSSTQFL